LKYYDFICHHGVTGQKWGVRRYQNADGSLTSQGRIHYYGKSNLKNATKSNLDSFGKDVSHNILYISGKSGSGKSTAALSLADENTSVIHLDSYFELNNQSQKASQNSRLNRYLRSNGFNPTLLNNKQLFNNNRKEYFKNVDHYQNLLESFSRQEYSSGRKVIVEGAELNDETMYSDKSLFKDKPTIRMNTSDSLSSKRAHIRDSNQ